MFELISGTGRNLTVGLLVTEWWKNISLVLCISMGNEKESVYRFLHRGNNFRLIHIIDIHQVTSVTLLGDLIILTWFLSHICCVTELGYVQKYSKKLKGKTG